MSKLPVVSGDDVIKVLLKIGYEIVRQKGSHVRLRNKTDKEKKPITVPKHKEIKPGLLKRILKDANLSVDEFKKLL